MTRSLAPIALLIIALGAVAGLQYLQRSPRTGYEAADFTLPDLNGKMHSLADFRGKKVLLLTWGSW